MVFANRQQAAVSRDQIVGACGHGAVQDAVVGGAALDAFRPPQGVSASRRAGLAEVIVSPTFNTTVRSQAAAVVAANGNRRE